MRNKPIHKASRGGKTILKVQVSFTEVMIRPLFGINPQSENGLLN